METPRVPLENEDQKEEKVRYQSFVSLSYFYVNISTWLHDISSLIKEHVLVSDSIDWNKLNDIQYSNYKFI